MTFYIRTWPNTDMVGIAALVADGWRLLGPAPGHHAFWSVMLERDG